jgi:hypothetical protein
MKPPMDARLERLVRLEAADLELVLQFRQADQDEREKRSR